MPGGTAALAGGSEAADRQGPTSTSGSSPDTGGVGSKGRQVVKKGGWASVFSGALSGAFISVCVQPLDVVRTKMQADAAHGIPAGPLRTMRALVAHAGVKTLWQGTQPTVIRLSLGAGSHFLILENMKAFLLARKAPFPIPGAAAPAPGPPPRLSAGEAALVGGLSRAAVAALLCPVTVVKTRMEFVAGAGGGAAVPRYSNTFDALARIAREERVRGLFRGVVPTIAANAPFSALYYMFYTQLQTALAAPERPQAAVNFTSGTLAAAAATILTQPADVIRTRMQLGLLKSEQGSLHALRSVIGKQGSRALVTGFAPRMVKRTLQTALVWTLYEELVPRLAAANTWARAALAQPHREPGPGAATAAADPAQ